MRMLKKIDDNLHKKFKCTNDYMLLKDIVKMLKLRRAVISGNRRESIANWLLNMKGL